MPPFKNPTPGHRNLTPNCASTRRSHKRQEPRVPLVRTAATQGAGPAVREAVDG
jgi:hypothetical protein